MEQKENHKLIDELLHQFVTAVQEFNYEEMERLTNDDFIIYENGSVWNTKEFFNALEGFQDVKINYNIDKLNIIVDNNTAHAQFINHGTFVYPDTTIHLNFIESSTFVKENGNWTIKFYHSTHLK
ncbi:MAG: nuclear transport factor 2 family protein [Salinivirgaceae bacterium]